MSDHGTAIQWTHVPGYKGETWNPTTGCDVVSPGCAHCYAKDFAERLKGMGQAAYQRDGDPKTSGPGFGLTLHPDRLDLPLRWRKPRAVFVNSMSDLFHEEIPDDYIASVFGRMAAAPQHIFMVLTKRPERMAQLLLDPEFENVMRRASGEMGHELPLPNVWLGVTIENRRFVDRADLLRAVPAAVRFISAEPLLGPLIYDGHEPGWLTIPRWADGFDGPELDLTDIDWLIAGGESGPEHRRFDPQWACDLRDACLEQCRPCVEGATPEYCKASRTRFFHKQNGGPRPDSNGRLLDGRTWDEFPVAA